MKMDTEQLKGALGAYMDNEIGFAHKAVDALMDKGWVYADGSLTPAGELIYRKEQENAKQNNQEGSSGFYP